MAALAGPERTLSAASLEAALFDRANGRQAFRRLTDAEVAAILDAQPPALPLDGSRLHIWVVRVIGVRYILCGLFAALGHRGLSVHPAPGPAQCGPRLQSALSSARVVAKSGAEARCSPS